MYQQEISNGLAAAVEEDLSGLNKGAIHKTLALMRHTMEHGTTPGRKRALGYDQGEWYCGTSACLAGWIYLANVGKLTSDGRLIQFWAAEILGADYDTCRRLFSGRWHTARLSDGIKMLEWLEQRMTPPNAIDADRAWIKILESEAAHV